MSDVKYGDEDTQTKKEKTKSSKRARKPAKQWRAEGERELKRRGEFGGRRGFLERE